MSGSWKKLSYPFKSNCPPIPVTSDEFIIVPQKNLDIEDHGIYKFNIKSNEWTKIIDYDDDFTLKTYSFGFNEDKGITYIFQRNKCLIFDINKKTINRMLIIYPFLVAGGAESPMICVNNKVHIFGNLYGQPPKHYIFDSETNQTILNFHESEAGLYGHRSIYLKSRKSILLCGCWGNKMFDSIYEFSLLSNKWTKLGIKLPLKLSHFAVVATRYDQYMITFGGQIEPDFLGYVQIDIDEQCDDIFVVDIKRSIVRKSKMKCPAKGICHAIITDNPYNDELLTFGFVNHFFQYLPHSIIQLQ